MSEIVMVETADGHFEARRTETRKTVDRGEPTALYEIGVACLGVVGFFGWVAFNFFLGSL